MIKVEKLAEEAVEKAREGSRSRAKHYLDALGKENNFAENSDNACIERLTNLYRDMLIDKAMLLDQLQKILGPRMGLRVFEKIVR